MADIADRIGSKLNVAATIAMARVYRLSLIKHRRVDIYAAIFTPGSDLARDKPAIGWLIYRSKSGYRRNFSFFSRETITKVELAQKSFDFSKSIHRVENENGRDNSIEIGLERTGLDCFAGQRAVFDRTFIFPPRGEGTDGIFPSSWHTYVASTTRVQ